MQKIRKILRVVSEKTALPTNQPINQPTNQPTKQPTNQTTNQPTNQPIIASNTDFMGPGRGRLEKVKFYLYLNENKSILLFRSRNIYY